MNGSANSSLAAGKQDEQGLTILTVYAQASGRYCVYGTRERIKICFADDPELQRLQRRRLLPISSLRSEIAGLLGDGNAPRGRLADWFAKKLRLHERRPQYRDNRWNEEVAFALVDALEGSGDTALATLTRIRDQLLSERLSRGRLTYLRVAAEMLFIIAGLALAFSVIAHYHSQKDVIVNLWRAVTAGALGAYFSIAQSISSRTVRADTQHWDYYADAITRISVGCIAALVLESLLDSGLFSIKLGGADLVASGQSAEAIKAHGFILTHWPLTIAAGFLAGFSERLIPDLMATATIVAAPPAPPPSAAPAAAPPAKPGAAAPPVKPLADDPDGVDVPASPTADDALDCCGDGHDGQEPQTADEDLPAASGGVATS